MIWKETMTHKRTSTFATYLCIALAFVSTAVHAQEAKPRPSNDVYKVEYLFSELQDNKKVNTRTYTVLVGSTEKASVRLGSRIPIAVGAQVTSGGKEGSTVLPTQFQYMDVGVNIDCSVDPLESDVGLRTNVDISRLAPENRIGQPIVRNTRISVHNVVPLGKQTMVASADEVDTPGRFQIEATVTKVK